MPINSGINVFTPRTLGDLLTLKSRKPEVALYAGGTYLLHGEKEKYPRLPRALASIAHIDELRRIHRTERYLEVGASVSLSQIMEIGGRTIPSILNQAIRTMATPPVRGLATMGGNICVQERRLTLFPVLFVLDTRVELRELGSSRWVPISRLTAQDGSLDLAPTEVLTRIRIPLGDWNVHCYRSLSSDPNWNRWSLSFCGLAHTDREVLTDFRFSCGSIGKYLLRNREIEAELVGRKLPLPARERNAVCLLFNEYLESTGSSSISSYQKNMASKLFRWFLSSPDLQ
jgi:CO/xanthine dehydrogenase FAD-binding subunit